MAPRRTEVWWLAGIAVLGLALRLYRLGALGLAGNEDYLAISVERILATGLPEFPSGVVYARALPLTYLTAGLALLFGTDEAVLRLPSVIFSTLSIAVVFFLARRLASTPVALLAALLVAVSDWEVQVGRTARMYAMLSAGCLLSVTLLDRALARRHRGPGVAAAISTAITGWTHQLAIGLGVMYACLPLHFKLDRGRLRPWVSCLVVLAVSAGSYYLVKRALYDRWDLVVAETRGGVWEEAPDVRDSLPREISDRYLGPWRTLRGSHAGAFAGLTTLAIASLAALGVVAWRRPRERLFAAALALVITALYLQQLALALLAAALYVVLGCRLQPAVYRSRALLLASLIAVAGAGWLLFGMAAAAPESAGGTARLKSALKPLLGYPPGFFRLYLERYPVMSALAICAMGVAAARYLRSGRVDRLGLLTLLFAGPMLALGFHPQAMGRMIPRYVSFLNPVFLVLVAFGAIWIGRRLWERCGRRRAPRVVAVTAYAALLLVATGFGSLRATLGLVSADYGFNPRFPDRTGIERHYLHPDHEGPARFVRARARPSDVVIAMDVLGTYAYLFRADYQLTLFGKPDAEGWLGARSLASAGELAGALDRHSGRRIWIILAATHVRWFADDPRLGAILRLIEERAGVARYRGRDGLSDVYLVAPGE